MDNNIVDKVKAKYANADKLLVGLDEYDNLHVAMYTGQGTYDSRPVDGFVDEIRETVIQLYEEGLLISQGTTLSAPGCTTLQLLRHIDD
tara:strand:+ start:7114 stop:7380 length:267 start_codon:yes stop_codon:yes gene_type:complete